MKKSKFSQNAQNYEEYEKNSKMIKIDYRFTKTKLWSKLNEETMAKK